MSLYIFIDIYMCIEKISHVYIYICMFVYMDIFVNPNYQPEATTTHTVDFKTA